MDSFESVIATLFEQHGFWVQTSFKVKLTDQDRKRIKRVSSPRWEVDLVAYKPKTNELYMIECKSFLDSSGVNVRAFNGSNPGFAKRFKLFTERGLFPVIKNRLIEQLKETGALKKKPTVKLVLVAGKIADKGREDLKKRFDKKNDWELWDEDTIYKKLKDLSEEGYDNTIVSVVSKILLRRKGPRSKKILYIDMDNVLVDFVSALHKESRVVQAKFKGRADEIPGLFGRMKPLKDAITSYKRLSKLYDTYILSTSPWGNPSAWSDKLGWVKKYLGKAAYKRLILSHHKNLNDGDFLIDDRTKNGVDLFRGEHIHFGQGQFKSWKKVVQYLVKKGGK